MLPSYRVDGEQVVDWQGETLALRRTNCWPDHACVTTVPAYGERVRLGPEERGAWCVGLLCVSSRTSWEMAHLPIHGLTRDPCYRGLRSACLCESSRYPLWLGESGERAPPSARFSLPSSGAGPARGGMLVWRQDWHGRKMARPRLSPPCTDFFRRLLERATLPAGSLSEPSAIPPDDRFPHHARLASNHGCLTSGPRNPLCQH